MKFNKERGQALLIIVLIMVVALTVGLSLGSRTIINIRTSSEEADSQKALAAAEAGIERALRVTSSATIGEQFNENKTIYSAEVKEVKGTTFLANGGNLVVQDDGIDVWLVSHYGDGKPNYSPPWAGDKLTIYWGDPSVDDCSSAALEVAVISKNPSPPPDFQLKRYAFDPCGGRRGENKFDNPGGGGPYTKKDKQFKYRAKDIDVENGIVVRVVPIYNSTVIAVESDSALPTQGFAIDSTGISGSGNRQVQRSLTFFRTYDQVVTAHFMYGLFTP